MTVYIEYVIIDNVIIDYLLLKATFALTGYVCVRKRLFLTAFLGALIALVYPLLDGVPIIMTAVKVLTGFLLTLVATTYKNAREYYITTLLFFTLTFLTGGAITGLFSLFSFSYSAEVSIAVMFLPVYVLLKVLGQVIAFLYRRKSVISQVCIVEMCFGGRTVKARGFFDTGNALYDGQSPVIVCEKQLFKKILGDNVLGVGLKKISVSTINGQTQNYALKLDSLRIYISNIPNIHNNVTLCLSNSAVGEGYDVILHPDLIKENNDEVIVQVENVS